MRSKQAPIHSGFGPQSAAFETLGDADLSGKIAVVTGGASGIGLETTRTLTQAGATVIVPARDPDKARQALASIPRAEVGKLDLMDPASIDAFAKAFLDGGRPLHLLINNAGIMAAPPVRDARGYESHVSANHLGHFHLTVRLWPALKQAAGARVVTLSSGAHRQAAVDFDDPNFERRTSVTSGKPMGSSPRPRICFSPWRWIGRVRPTAMALSSRTPWADRDEPSALHYSGGTTGSRVP